MGVGAYHFFLACRGWHYSQHSSSSRRKRGASGLFFSGQSENSEGGQREGRTGGVTTDDNALRELPMESNEWVNVMYSYVIDGRQMTGQTSHTVY